jgi:RNA polymerase sigma-70 factor (ECF subfamily)
MNICIRYNRNYDEAGAALNAIYMKIISNLSRYDLEKPLLPWVKTIAMNHLTDEFRKSESLRNMISFNEDLGMFENGRAAFDSQTTLAAKDLLKMIQALPQVSQRVFNLYAIDGFNHREIGEMLGMSEGTSKWYLHEARAGLQQMLEEEQKKTNTIRFEKSR